MPPSAATAQTLPCGTPGQGSGSRSLQTPGSTFSARGASGRLRSSAIGGNPLRAGRDSRVRTVKLG